ncbi:MAG: ABC transporter permease subunit, partial [Microbacterium sp.]
MTTPTTETSDSVDTASPSRNSRRAARIAESASVGWKLMLFKVVMLGLIDALALYAIFVLIQSGQWIPAIIVFAVTAFANWIYFSRGNLPAKYLVPGLIFLFVFQIFAAVYTGYIAFTNYGTGHNSDKDSAVNSLMLSAQERV